MLTAEKVADGFKAAGERIDGVEATVKEINKAFDALAKQIKLLKALNASGQLYSDDNKSFWGCEEHAKQFGEVVLAALGRKKAMAAVEERKDMGEGTNTGGGYLVPDELQRRFIDLLGRFGKFRRNATVLSMSTSRALVPKLESDLTIYCPGEGGEITKSDATLSQVTLTPKTWAALAAVSNELDEDSVVAVGEIVAMSIARSMARKEDLVGFIGDGTETYFGMKGIVGALRAVSSTISEIAGLKVASGNAYSEITLGDFRGAIRLLPEEYEDTAKWYMSKKFYYDVVWPLAETAGVANIFEILSDRKSRYLLGYEVEFVSCMPSTEANSQICALLGDLQMGAYLAERRILTIEQSRDVYFKNYQTGIRGIERIDINVFGVGDKTNPGPIVGMITAAA